MSQISEQSPYNMSEDDARLYKAVSTVICNFISPNSVAPPGMWMASRPDADCCGALQRESEIKGFYPNYTSRWLTYRSVATKNRREQEASTYHDDKIVLEELTSMVLRVKVGDSFVARLKLSFPAGSPPTSTSSS